MEDNMVELNQLVSTAIGKVFIGVIIALIVVIVAIGFHDLRVSGERNVLEQTVETKEAEIVGKVKEVEFMKVWMERDKLDAVAKDAEFNRTMATKPKFVTQIEYVPTGDNCVDLNAIAEEARKNAEWSKL